MLSILIILWDRWKNCDPSYRFRWFWSQVDEFFSFSRWFRPIFFLRSINIFLPKLINFNIKSKSRTIIGNFVVPKPEKWCDRHITATESWNHCGAWSPVVATASKLGVHMVINNIPSPQSATGWAIAISPSGCVKHWNAMMGAIKIGISTDWPKTCVLGLWILLTHINLLTHTNQHSRRDSGVACQKMRCGYLAESLYPPAPLKYHIIQGHGGS